MSPNLQILFLRDSQTKPIVSFVSYCLLNPSTVCIFRTNCSISGGGGGEFHQIKPKQYPNRKCQKNKKSYFSTSDSFCLITLHISLQRGMSKLYSETNKNHKYVFKLQSDFKYILVLDSFLYTDDVLFCIFFLSFQISV